MKKSEKFANPFYGLLLVAGIAFVLTATLYGIMVLHEVRAARALEPPGEKVPLMTWMERHGNLALLAELGLLAVFTVGAIGTDDYWQRRRKKPVRAKPQPGQNAASRAALDEPFRFTVEQEPRPADPPWRN